MQPNQNDKTADRLLVRVFFALLAFIAVLIFQPWNMSSFAVKDPFSFITEEKEDVLVEALETTSDAQSETTNVKPDQAKLDLPIWIWPVNAQIAGLENTPIASESMDRLQLYASRSDTSLLASFSESTGNGVANIERKTNFLLVFFKGSNVGPIGDAFDREEIEQLITFPSTNTALRQLLLQTLPLQSEGCYADNLKSPNEQFKSVAIFIDAEMDLSLQSDCANIFTAQAFQASSRSHSFVDQTGQSVQFEDVFTPELEAYAEEFCRTQMDGPLLDCTNRVLKTVYNTALSDLGVEDFGGLNPQNQSLQNANAGWKNDVIVEFVGQVDPTVLLRAENSVRDSARRQNLNAIMRAGVIARIPVLNKPVDDTNILVLFTDHHIVAGKRQGQKLRSLEIKRAVKYSSFNPPIRKLLNNEIDQIKKGCFVALSQPNQTTIDASLIVVDVTREFEIQTECLDAAFQFALSGS